MAIGVASVGGSIGVVIAAPTGVIFITVDPTMVIGVAFAGVTGVAFTVDVTFIDGQRSRRAIPSGARRILASERRRMQPEITPSQP